MQFDAKAVWERNAQEFLGQRHGRAHQRQCYIANALKTDARIEVMAL